METIFELLKLFFIGIGAGVIYIGLYMFNKNRIKKEKKDNLK